MFELEPFPRLNSLLAAAKARGKGNTRRLGVVFPCDALALETAQKIQQLGIARPVLVGPADKIQRAAESAGVDVRDFELVESGATAPEAATMAAQMAARGQFFSLMKGSLHTDELMSAIVSQANGLRTERRISHAFVFDLPRYHKLLALADCVVNIKPNLRTKQDILTNAVQMLQQCLGLKQVNVGVVTAVETVNPAIEATVDAQALVDMSKSGQWSGATVEGPFGFDNAFSAKAAQVKGIKSSIAGDLDLMLMPDLNAGNMLYKSFNYVGGGECAGLVLGAGVPVVLTSRADSIGSRVASVALAVLCAQGTAGS